jgi:H+-translocating NAD(P) transhydrogenase subunit alpha
VMFSLKSRKGRWPVARSASPWKLSHTLVSPDRGDGSAMLSPHLRPSRGSVSTCIVNQALAPQATDQRPYQGFHARLLVALLVIIITLMTTCTTYASEDFPFTPSPNNSTSTTSHTSIDYISMLFVFMLATFIGIGVIRRVSRLLHTPLMSLTNAISAIAVVGAIIVAGGEHYPTYVRVLGAIALFASMTNIISGFLITERMLKMFKSDKETR